MKTLLDYLIEKNIEFEQKDDELIISKTLYFERDENILLPDNLTIHGNLNIEYTNITSLPHNLKVDRFIYIRRNQITLLSNKLKNKVKIRIDNKGLLNIYISKSKITIGCKEKSLSKWEDFFKNKKRYNMIPCSVVKNFKNAVKLHKQIFECRNGKYLQTYKIKM